MSGSRLRSIGAAVAAMAAMACSAAQADPRERFSALEENDSLYFNTDKHYTQGLRLSYLAPDYLPDDPRNRVFDVLDALPSLLFGPSPGGERSRRTAYFIGQSIFTPKDVKRAAPDPRDRPYAGWVYGGLSLLQENDGRVLDHFELQLGIGGPGAWGEFVQNDWHQIIGKATAVWNDQLQTEPGIDLSYERKWAVPLVGSRAGGLDLVPEAGATLGNVFTYASAGALIRLGRNLGMDYGAVRIRPALSGTDYFNADHAEGTFGFYVYAGAQGRAVGRNLFLDGNTWRASPWVPKKIWVADLQAGVALFSTTGFRLDVSVVRRTPEFDGQATPDVIGTAALTYSW
jgi:lipid A 3-O-deacylase